MISYNKSQDKLEVGKQKIRVKTFAKENDMKWEGSDDAGND